MSEKLTVAQRKMLEWLLSCDLEVKTPTVANRLVDRGLATQIHCARTGDTFFRITPAGRAALKEGSRQ